MTYRMKRTLTTLLSVSMIGCAALLTTACDRAVPTEARVPAVYLNVALDVSGVSGQLTAPIDSASITVSASDLTGLNQYNLKPATAGTFTASIAVPVGQARHFDVAIFSRGTIVAVGSAVADIAAGGNPTLTIPITILAGPYTGPSSVGLITVTITTTTTSTVFHIAPKTVSATAGDTVRFRMLDAAGFALADPVNFPANWTYDATSFVVPQPGQGIIYWETVSTLCGQIDASGLLRVITSSCTFKVVGHVGTQADTATVTVAK